MYSCAIFKPDWECQEEKKRKLIKNNKVAELMTKMMTAVPMEWMSN